MRRPQDDAFHQIQMISKSYAIAFTRADKRAILRAAVFL